MTAAVGVRYALTPLLGHELPFTRMLGGVVVAVWSGGTAPASFASLLGYLAARALFVAPHHVFTFDNAKEVFLCVVYVLTSLLIVFFGATLRQSRNRSKTLA